MNCTIVKIFERLHVIFKHYHQIHDTQDDYSHKNHATRYYILTPCILQCEVLLIYYLKVFNFFTTLGHIDKTTKKNCRLSLKVGKNRRFAPENPLLKKFVEEKKAV